MRKETKKPAASSLSVEALENVADLYIRVSTTEQAKEGFSVEEQETRLRSYCEAYGYIINAVHVDPGYSGATLERPGIKEVIKDVRAGRCNKIIVWKLDRLSRSQKDTLILLEDVFLENSCDFVSLMESFDTSTPFGRCVVGILAAFAQMERENIKARTMMGKQAGLKDGNYYSGRTPLGYKYERQANGKRALVVDPLPAQAIKEMYRLYNSGRSMSEIGNFIQERYGLFLNLGRTEACGAVSRTLQNPLYCGRVRYGSQEYEGKHEALVTPEEWQTVNNTIQSNRKEYNRQYVKSDGLLSGMIFCGCCGARMSICKIGGKGGKRIKKYVCYSVSKASAAMVKDPNCTNRRGYFPITELDGIVLEEIRKLTLDPAALDSLIAQSKTEPEPAQELFADRMSELEKQAARLLNLYQAGVVEIEEIQERLGAIKEERAKLQRTMEELEPAGKMSKAAAVECLDSFAGILENGDNEALYNLTHSLIEKVIVYKKDVVIHWKFC